METKEEYRAALDRILATYYNLDNSISAGKKFNEDMKLLYGLVNEHFEEKPETNYEHYKDEIIEGWMLDLALVDGKLKRCSRTDCNECEFNPGVSKGCKQRLIEWVKKPYEKPEYKLSQFEYDLINAYDRCKECCLLNEIECLKRMSEKGYFKGIDSFTKVHDIIDNCEVIQ